MAGKHDFYIPVDYKVYEGGTLIGRQAYICGQSLAGVIEFVIESFGGTVIVESGEASFKSRMVVLRSPLM